MSRLSLADVRQKGDEHTWEIFRELHFGWIFPSGYHNTGVRNWQAGLDQGQDWRDAMLESLQPQDEAAAAPAQPNLTEEQQQKMKAIADTKRDLLNLLQDMIQAEKGLLSFQSAEVNDADLWKQHTDTLDRADELSRLLDSYDNLTGFEQMGDPAMQAIHGYVRGLQRVKNRLDLEADRLSLADQRAEYRRFREQYDLYTKDSAEIKRIADWGSERKVRVNPETLGTDLDKTEKAVNDTRKQIQQYLGLAEEYEKKAKAARSLELRMESGWYYACQIGAPMCRIADCQDKFRSDLQRISDERSKLQSTEASIPEEFRRNERIIFEAVQKDVLASQDHTEAGVGKQRAAANDLQAAIADALAGNPGLLNAFRQNPESRSKLMKQARSLVTLRLKQDKLAKEEQQIRSDYKKAHTELEATAGEEIKQVREKYRTERKKYLEQHKEPYDPEKIEQELKHVEKNAEKLRQKGYTVDKFTEKAHTALQQYIRAREFDPEKYDYKEAPDAANAPEYIRWYRAGKAARDMAKSLRKLRLSHLIDYQEDLGAASALIEQFNQRHDHEANRTFVIETLHRPLPGNPTMDIRIQNLQDSLTRLCIEAENSGWGGSKTLGDSKEFTRMKTALQTLTQPDQMTAIHVREALDAAQGYLNAKAGGIHWTNSTIRQFRLNLAQNILQLSDLSTRTFEMIENETNQIKDLKVLARSLDHYAANPQVISEPEAADGFDRLSDIMDDNNVLIRDAKNDLLACVKDAEQAAPRANEPEKAKAADKQPNPADEKAAPVVDQGPLMRH